jgi:hypothetical protein
MDANQIPGYREAVAAEREARDYAFLELPREICGIDAAPLTLYRLVTRFAIGCPFLGESNVMERPDPAGEIASFIWHVSVARSRTLGRPLAEYHARNALVEHLASIETSESVVAIHDYLNWMLLDAPPPSDGPSRAPVASIAAGIIDVFGSQYSWSRYEVMHAPIEQLFQLIREITVRNNPKAALPNRRSGKVIGRYLDSLNAAASSAAPTAEGDTKADPS